VGARDALGIWETEKVLINTSDDTELLIIEMPVNQK